MVCLLALPAACKAPTQNDNTSDAATTSGTSDSSIVNADSVPDKTLPGSVTIAMVGDIMMGNTWPHDRLPVDDGKHLFDDVAPILQKADIACGNFEGVAAPRDMGKPRKNQTSKLTYMFKMPPRYLPYLKDAGFDFLSLANNHIYDFWGDPINFTESELAKLGIGYAGAKNPQKKDGHTLTSYKTQDGVRYGFAAFGVGSYTPRLQDYEEVKRIIQEMRSQSDVVIVYFHGGTEGKGARRLPNTEEIFYGESRGNLREFARVCVDNGADLVFGSGPHVVRAIELYKGHFIAYSLGNFCTCGMSISGINGLAPCITVEINPADGQFKSGKIHSFRQKSMAGPKTDTTGEAAREIRDLTHSDIVNSSLLIADDGTISIK